MKKEDEKKEDEKKEFEKEEDEKKEDKKKEDKKKENEKKDFIGSSVQENFCSVFSIVSLVKKILPNKIVSLYSIFFSRIVYRY